MKPMYMRIFLLLIAFSFPELAFSESNSEAMLGWRMVEGKLVTPTEAREILTMDVCVLPQMETLSGTATEATSEIVELARGLRNDPNLIYKFVYNHIDYTPIFGSVKGATMTLLDKSGNDFDQVSLLITLLRQAGFTASYVYGKVRLNPSQLINWLGVANDPNVVAKLLGSAGIPSQIWVYSDGSLAYADLDHVWAKVNINGTNYMFDPSFKSYYSTTGIDLQSAMGYDANTFLAEASEGATIQTDYVKDINKPNLAAELNSYSTNLINHIRTNLPAASLKEVIGGRIVVPATEVPRQTSLPYQLSITYQWTEIPTAYKVSLRIQHRGIDSTVYSEQIYGKRLTIFYNTSNQPVLALEGQTLATGSTTTPGTSQPITFTVNHPYAANGGTYCDANKTFNITAGGAYLVVNGWAGTGTKVIEKHRKILKQNCYAGGSDTSEPVLGESLAMMAFTWLAECSRASQITGRITGTTTIDHHTLGVCGQYNSPYIDIPMYTSSIVSNTGDLSKERASFLANGGQCSAFEWGVVEQLQPHNAVSTVKLVDIANSGTYNKFFDANSSNYYSTIKSQLVNYDSSEFSSIESYINAGLRVILPQNGDLVEDEWTGIGFLVLSSLDNQIGFVISGDLNGGYGTETWTLSDIPIKSASSSVSHSTSSEPIDLVTGDYLYDNTDLTIGSGSFPFSIGFKRSYNSSASLDNGPMGLGWKHNLGISATLSSDGFEGLGKDSPIDTVTSIVESYVALDLLSSAKTNLRLTVATMAHRWFMDRLINNVVTIDQPGNTMQFVKLADGNFNPPPGEAAKLTTQPDNSYLLKTKHGEYLDFDPNGRIATWSDLNNAVSFTYGTNGKLSKVSNVLGRSLTFTYDTNDANHIASVTDSAGRIVQFAYSTKGNLIRVTDANGFITTFVYDPNNDGRITQIYYPTEPNNPFVTNFYDSLGHVKTQTNADGFTYQYYYTSYQTEEVDPCNYSNIYNFNDHGRLVTQTNPLGNQTTYQYDGQLRKTLITYPQGNTTRYTYDSNHNVLQSIQVPAAGSGDPNIVETFTYEPNFNRVTTYTDPNGKTTTSQYYSNGKIRQIDQPIVDGEIPRTLFTYNSHGQTETVTDPEGMVTKNQYDPNGNLISTIIDYGGEPNKLNITTTMTYNAVGDVNSTTDPRGNKTTYQYDSMRRLIKTTLPLPFNYITLYDYYPDGSLKELSRQIDAPNQWQVTTYTYTPSSKIETVTDPNGDVTEYEYDALDRLWKTTDAENHTTTRLYDAAGQLWKVIDANDNNSVIYSYNANGSIETLTDAKGNTTAYQYDGHSRLKKTIFPNSTFEQLTYDITGNISQKQTRGGQTISYGYDTLNRLKTKTFPGPQQIQYTYDLTSRTKTVTDVSGTIRHSYDRIGRLTDVTCPDGKIVSYQYDAAGNRTTLTYPDGNGINYTYDQLNRLVNIRTSEFDEYTKLMLHCNAIPFVDEMEHTVTNNNVTLDTTNKKFGAGSASFNGTSSYLSLSDSADFGFSGGIWTIDCQIFPLSFGSNQTIFYQKTDNNNWMALTMLANGACEFDVVAGGVVVIFVQAYSVDIIVNSWNHIAVVEHNDSYKIFINGIDRTSGGGTNTNRLPVYTGAFEIGAFQEGAASCWDGRIDELRVSKGIARWTSNFTPPSAEYTVPGEIVEYSYDVLSRRTGAQFANGTSATYSYNIADRLLNLNNQMVGSSRNFAYSYDKVGNRLTMITDGTNLHQYSYDKIYQLKSVNYPVGFFAANTVYNYDLAGNRSSVIADSTTNYAANNLNQYTSVSGVAYSYDNNGNLTNDGNNTYSYDVENRLISAVTPTKSVVYQYDAFGKRISKTINGQITKYFYDGDQIICEYNDDGILLRKYVYGTGIDEVIRMSSVLPSADIIKDGSVNFSDYSVLARVWLMDADDSGFDPNADLMPDGVIDYKDLEIMADNWLGTGCSNGDYYYHYDGLGSVIALSNASGQIVESYHYDVYGKAEIRDVNNSVVSVSSVANPFMFTAREYDAETGNYYYRARFYSPTLGRFLQTDPIGYSDGVNWYAYCGNNPIMLIDSYGLCSKAWEGAWKGDFAGDTSWGGIGAQVGMGFIPIVGQIADARDTVANIRNVWNNPKSVAAWAGLGGAGIAWIPGIGDAARGVYRGGRKIAVESAQAATKEVAKVGSYTLNFASGMKYAGKGPMSRAEQSARMLSEEYSDTVVKIDWSSANSGRQAFKDEARRLKEIKGPKDPGNYNKINSPGTRYIEEDGF